MEGIELIKITVTDVLLLQKIGRQTFEETFSKFNSEKNMKNYLDASFSEAKLLKELEDKNSDFYFATFENEVIGYLKINFGPSQTELKDSQSLEIERIYVLNKFHGKNVGQVLYDKAVQIANQQGAAYIWLGVWEKNERALHFYKKNGFVEFDKHQFRLGDDEQTDLMMKLKI